MFCTKCGAQNPAGTNFCARCGAPMGEQAAAQAPVGVQSATVAQVKVLKRLKKLVDGGNKKLLVGISVAVVLLLVMSAATLLMLTGSVAKFERQIKGSDFSEAESLYYEMKPDQRSKANEWLADYIETVAERYYSGDFDYTTTQSILGRLRTFDVVCDRADALSQELATDNSYTIAYETGKRYAEEENWKEAVLSLSEVGMEYRFHDEAAELQQSCIDQYRAEVLAQCEADYEADNIVAVMDGLYNALDVLPGDTELALQILTYTDRYIDKTLEEAAAMAEAGDYAGAYSAVASLEWYNMTNDDVYAAMERYSNQSTEEVCAQYAAEEDYLGAVIYLQNNDLTDSDFYATYTGLLVEQTLAKAQALADERDFDGAIRVISEVQIDYDCDAFVSAVENYQSSKPRRLIECYVIDHATYYRTEDEITDNLGVLRENVGKLAWSKCYAIFNLEKRFTRLTGEIMPREGSESEGVKIYGDDVLLLDCGDLSVTSNPYVIDLDIRGIAQLKIEQKDGFTLLDLDVS